MNNIDYNKDVFKSLCDEFAKNNTIDQSLYEKYQVKRGLRNSDGSGVMAGITNICNVHGYVFNEGEREPVEGELIYRGYSINDIVENTTEKGRFGFEETVYLLLFGQLPTEEQLMGFNEMLFKFRELPPYFSEDMIFKAPSRNIMNKMARSVLALYSYEADIVGLLVSATEPYSLFPPNITCMVNREVIGIVTKSNQPGANPERAENWLELSGCKKIFKIDSVTGFGVNELIEYLNK